MKRPMLVSGITMIIVAVFLMIFSKIGAVVLLLTGALAFVLYLIKPLKLRKFIVIPAVILATIFICTSFLTFSHFKLEPALKYDGNITYISGKVITTPVNNSGYLNFTLKTDKIGKNCESLKIDVIIPENDENPELYDYISIDYAEITVNRNDDLQYDLTTVADGVLLNASGGDAHILWQCEKTHLYYCLKLREIISDKINAHMPEDTAGLLNGLIFGGGRNVSDHVIEAFRSGGISHLLAVSGLHTSLWCGLVISILNLFKVPKKARNIICIIFLLCFCTITGFTPSVLRSSLMSLLVFTSPLAKTQPDSLNSLGFATTILLLSNPYLIFNLSFQLSFCATLGVLMVSYYEMKILSFFRKIKFRPLSSLLGYSVCSFLISAGAGLFTMPVAAFNFRNFSIVAPITNILCVKPAFYAMICGTVATVTSYIEVSFIQKITHFLFDVSDFLLSLVSKISLKISEFKYCTLPVHKNWLLNGLICGAVILGIVYIIFKFKKKLNVLKFGVFISVIALFLNISVPLLPTPYQNTLTVVSSGNNINIIVRSGTHYAYLLNSDTEYPSQVYDYLPIATCESLDYWFVTYATYSSCKDFERLCNVITPVETHTTPFIWNLCLNKNITLPENTLVKPMVNYSLNNKINLEIIDTYSIKYVIIKGNKKTVYIHLHGDTDFSKFVDTALGDIFIYNGKVPDKIPETAESIIISGDSEFIINEDYNDLKFKFKNIHLTAQDGDFKINI